MIYSVYKNNAPKNLEKQVYMNLEKTGTYVHHSGCRIFREYNFQIVRINETLTIRVHATLINRVIDIELVPTEITQDYYFRNYKILYLATIKRRTIIFKSRRWLYESSLFNYLIANTYK